jgi:hypothetical protein
MSQSRLDITDREGWQKAAPVEKAIIYIGSDPSNDIVLDRARGSGVAPRHVQLIAPTASGQVYRLVNLGDSDVVIGQAGDKVVPPRSFAAVTDGENIRMGDFSLILRTGEVPAAAPADKPLPGGVEHPSNVIGIRLFLPGTQLAPDHPLEGSITVSNRGNRPGVQFKLEVEGLEPDCYELGAGPVLFPGAEKGVVFRLVHPCRPRPLAGEHRFSVRATAPDAYPGESAVAPQVIRILPYFSHTLRLVT